MKHTTQGHLEGSFSKSQSKKMIPTDKFPTFYCSPQLFLNSYAVNKETSVGQAEQKLLIFGLGL